MASININAISTLRHSSSPSCHYETKPWTLLITAGNLSYALDLTVWEKTPHILDAR